MFARDLDDYPDVSNETSSDSLPELDRVILLIRSREYLGAREPRSLAPKSALMAMPYSRYDLQIRAMFETGVIQHSCNRYCKRSTHRCGI